MTIVECLKNCAYNLDRAAASLLGAHPQATLSSEIGRQELNWAGAILNGLDPDHIAKAQAHAKRLQEADAEHVKKPEEDR